ncbi:acetyltransferase [Bacillus thuringiensis serovar yunnanensis]|nr:acetyltransferase [Bacillus thuringiensis serovar yunnanensis]
MSNASTHKNNRYMAAIDSLRGIAILAVIVYHINFNWLPGGFLGVTVFFVLSGYLITDILIAEWEQYKVINLKEFWLRRARRLLPGMIVMLVIVLAWITLFNNSLLGKIRGDVLAALLYISNWWFIYHKVSYFDNFGQQSPLNHFWSLAVEEQFYLIWPLFLTFCFCFIKKKSHIIRLILLGGIMSALGMAIMYQPDVDPSRVYYGTDTRTFSLLIGAVLALVWPSRQLSKTIIAPARWGLDIAGGISLILILVMFWKVNQYDSFVYYGGMLLLSIVTAILVAVLAHPASLLNKLLKFKPLHWIGVRSYGLYLWHYPIFVLTSPIGEGGQTHVIRFIFQLLLSFIMAQLSWKFIENPIRQGTFSIRGHIRLKNWRISNFSFGSRLMFICVLLVPIVAIWGLSTASYTKDSFQTNTVEAIKKEHSKELTSPQNKASDESISKSNKPEAEGIQKPKDVDQKVADNSNQSKEPLKVTAIGDSIMVGVTPYLKEVYPNIIIDAEVGRQMSQAVSRVQLLINKGELGDYVIIGLGTNGTFSNEKLTTLLELIGNNRKVLLINTKVPDPWESIVNKKLKEGSSRFSNVKLIDWYSASAGHEEYFVSDKTHLNKKGAKVYVQLITDQIQSINKK